MSVRLSFEAGLLRRTAIHADSAKADFLDGQGGPTITISLIDGGRPDVVVFLTTDAAFELAASLARALDKISVKTGDSTDDN